MESKSFGYARVSSKDQNVYRQIESLSKYIADERDIFVDQISGKDMNRPALQSLLHVVRDGDTVYVHSLDRLGRNKEDIKCLFEKYGWPATTFYRKVKEYEKR